MLAMNLALAIGIMIIVGFFAGRLFHRFKFPMITGYIVAGVLLSPSLLNIISSARVDDLEVFTSIALGIIAYSIGGSLHWKSMQKLEKSIFTIGLMQAAGAWLLSMLAIVLIAPFSLICLTRLCSILIYRWDWSSVRWPVLLLRRQSWPCLPGAPFPLLANWSSTVS